MPPKKKKGEGKKGKKSGKAPVAAVPLPEPLPEASREYYLAQIRDLEHRLERYQRKCDELSVLNGEFKSQYDQLTTDKKEIVSFLKKSLENRGEEIADLNDRLIGLQQAKDNEKEHYETQLQQLRTEFQETKDQLTSENMILGGKLAALEEFKIQKEDYVLQVATLREQIAQQEADHKEEIYRLERKQVVDKDRLKKDMVMRVNQVAAEFRKVSNKQMAETTKRTIRENVSINAQLAKMSDKTMELILENDELKQKEKQQKQHIEMLEVNEKELAKKNISSQKIIKMMTEKAKAQDVLLTDYEEQEEQYHDMMTEADQFRKDLFVARSEVVRLEEETKYIDQAWKDTRKISEMEKKVSRKLKKILSDAASAIKTALKKSSTEDVEESTFDIIEKRDNMLENLLVLLNSAVLIGVGPTPAEFGTSGEVRLTSPPRMPGTGSGLKDVDVPTTHKGTSVAHYQLGDLGIIPKPDQYIPTYFEKMKDATAVQQLGSLKKVLTRSVGVQTISTQKAVFYADQLLSRFPNSSNLIHKIDSRTNMLKKQQTA